MVGLGHRIRYMYYSAPTDVKEYQVVNIELGTSRRAFVRGIPRRRRRAGGYKRLAGGGDRLSKRGTFQLTALS